MCDIEFDESPSVWERTKHRARVVHWCDVCGRIIHSGEPYENVFAIYDGEAVNDHACLGCSRAIEKFGSAHGAYPFPSSFSHFLHECIIDDDEGARWKPMAAAIRRRKDNAKASGSSKWQRTDVKETT